MGSTAQAGPVSFRPCVISFEPFRIVSRMARVALAAVACLVVTVGLVTIVASWLVSVSIGLRTGTQRNTLVGFSTQIPNRTFVVATSTFVEPAAFEPFKAFLEIEGSATAYEEYFDPTTTGSITLASFTEMPTFAPTASPTISLQSPIADPNKVPLPPSKPQLAAFQVVPGSRLLPSGDSLPPRTAVYDIEARTVYLPNGQSLEAHSGFGPWMDDPRNVHRKNRGATPPNTYLLTLRETPFHGVQAIRLNPIDEDKMFGRDGILAHSYLLGPNGQSHGCISFKDYPKFLRAFLRGEIDRIVVVPRQETHPIRSARANFHATR